MYSYPIGYPYFLLAILGLYMRHSSFSRNILYMESGFLTYFYFVVLILEFKILWKTLTINFALGGPMKKLMCVENSITIFLSATCNFSYFLTLFLTNYLVVTHESSILTFIVECPRVQHICKSIFFDTKFDITIYM